MFYGPAYPRKIAVRRSRQHDSDVTRQSERTPVVCDGAQASSGTAPYVGDRIRKAMYAAGWVTDDGRLDVERLAQALGCRWQTAQFWVLGRTAPSIAYARRIAVLFGMTLEQLMGAATGQEPTSEAWLAFVAGASPTAQERQALAAMVWPHGTPDVAAYRMALAAMRSVR